MTLSDTDSNGKRFHVLLKFNGFQSKSSSMAFELFIMHFQPGLEVIKLFSCSTQVIMKFTLLIYVKNCWHFNIY